MLLAGIVLGVTTALLEFSIYLKVKPLRDLIHKFDWAGLILSASLAILLGHIFGATGITATIGGVSAMVLTQPVYLYINKGHKWLKTNLDRSLSRIYQAYRQTKTNVSGPKSVRTLQPN